MRRAPINAHLARQMTIIHRSVHAQRDAITHGTVTGRFVREPLTAEQIAEQEAAMARVRAVAERVRRRRARWS